MPRSADFDNEAMERKIKKNLDAGFTVPTIKIALLEELQDHLKNIRIREARMIELTDQMDYMNEKYVT
jgi:hypothetical protein